jgi:signal transduction histidine kinase/PAS domain-containing protein
MAVIESGEPESYEFYNEQLKLWRRITNTPLGDGFVMTMEDITEQKRISEEIEESARLLNAVLDASPIALVVYAAIRDDHDVIQDFQPIVVNRQALEISGYTSERFLRETFFERSPPSRELRLDALRKVVEEQHQERFEHQVYSTGRWVDSIATPFGDGFIATSKDITALKEQTRIIEEQAMLFEGVLSSLQNGLTILGIIRNDAGELEDLRYLQIADITVAEMRMPRDAIIGNTMRNIYPGIDQTNYWSAYRAVVETGTPQHFETHFTMQGYDNYLLNWVTPLGSDKLVSVYYIVNDLKRTQKELEHTVHELKRSNDDLEQFASVASHDLQEPLRKLQSFGSMLEQRYADRLDENGVNLLQRMQGAAGRMRDLVSGLLSFARLSGYSDGKLVPVDLALLLHSVMADLDEALASAKGAISIRGAMPQVAGIEGQLRHLFHNLLTNAIKFRKAGVRPRIEVTARPREAADRV